MSARSSWASPCEIVGDSSGSSACASSGRPRANCVTFHVIVSPTRSLSGQQVHQFGGRPVRHGFAGQGRGPRRRRAAGCRDDRLPDRRPSRRTARGRRPAVRTACGTRRTTHWRCGSAMPRCDRPGLDGTGVVSTPGGGSLTTPRSRSWNTNRPRVTIDALSPPIVSTLPCVSSPPRAGTDERS